jgi:hypothetical protein
MGVPMVVGVLAGTVLAGIISYGRNIVENPWCFLRCWLLV